MRTQSFWYRNSLSLTIFFFFLAFLIAQSVTGWHENNSELEEWGKAPLSYSEYLKSAHFVEATFENWESEFLQMGMYVIFTVFLRQKGSSESKKIGEREEVDRVPVPHEKAPWPVRKGGLWLKLYKNSLVLAFFVLFLFSFTLHSISSFRDYNQEQEMEGKHPVDFPEFMTHSRVWFESFQNWQSEFIAVLSIVLLSIFLRQFGSPESKPVDAANSDTGK